MQKGKFYSLLNSFKTYKTYRRSQGEIHFNPARMRLSLIYLRSMPFDQILSKNWQTNTMQGCSLNCQSHHECSTLLQTQDLWIESLLMPEALLRNEDQFKLVSGEQSHTELALHDLHDYILPLSRSKSIFHNFQKHLTVVLKKLIQIRRNQLDKIVGGQLAYKLWKYFLDIPSYNKKVLQEILGDDHSSKKTNSVESTDLSKLSILKSKYSVQQLKDGQKCLREAITIKGRMISRQYLLANCKITTKLESFYEYFVNFLDEVQHNSLSKRISKQRKANMTDKIQSNLAQ